MSSDDDIQEDSEEHNLFESVEAMPIKAVCVAAFIPIVPVIVENNEQPPKVWGVYGRDIDDRIGAAFLLRYQ